MKPYRTSILHIVSFETICREVAQNDNITRLSAGFRNHFTTEALPGALPDGQNSPQRCPYGLYAEQLSGSAFTAPRHHNLRSWLYRIRPSVVQSGYEPLEVGKVATSPLDNPAADPNQMRWDPAPLPEAPTDFIDGLLTVAVNGDADAQRGCGVHVYAFNRDMVERFFYNADGELLVVPQQGGLRLRTELGELDVTGGEIAVIPRGVKFQVRLAEGSDTARGYICENYGMPLELPGLGPIGANGLANPRDFESPVAAYEDREGDIELVAKFSGRFWPPAWITRPWMWWPGMATTRPTSTTWRVSTPSTR